MAKAPTIRDRIIGLKRVKAGDLLPHPKNWRRHPEAQQTAMRASLREIGWADALLARQTPDGLCLIDGHLRRDLSPDTKVPVLILDLTEAEADKLLATLDPLAGLAETDFSALAELADSIVWDEPDLAAMVEGLSEPESPEIQQDEAPEATDGPCVAAVGDVWACGRHRVLCGDATNEAAVGAFLGDVRPFIMVTDPPYGVSVDHTWRDKTTRNRLAPARTGLVANDDHADWTAAWQLFPGDVLYVWHSARHCGEVFDHLAAAGFDVRQQIIWRKSIHVLGRAAYQWQHEPCWYGVRNRRASRWCGDRKQSTVWDAASPIMAYGGGGDDTRSPHPTQKPVECMARPIRNHGAPGDVVYDPFLGSGTTLIAAEQLDRTCYGIEIEPKYVDVICKRYLAFTGDSPVRESDGAKFADLMGGE